tara:strand:+ start:307 stop:555 length:249 start_codon:yes stop_codon:yes gene_type:complete
MEEFLKLENLYNEIQLIENAEEKEAIHFIYDRAGAEACLGNLDSVEFFAVMLEMNMKHQKIDEMKLMDFFQGYEMKMLGGDQ